MGEDNTLGGPVSYSTAEEQDSFDLPTSSPSTEFDFAADEVETVTMNEIIDAYIPTTSPSDTSQPDEDTFSHDLYNGAQISVGLSLILIMSFVINHSLTDAALNDLLRIISLHCPSPTCVLLPCISSRSALQLLSFTSSDTTTVHPARRALITYD